MVGAAVIEGVGRGEVDFDKDMGAIRDLRLGS